MKQAYYAAKIAKFLKELPKTVLGDLTGLHAHDLEVLQRNAWIAQITLLQNELRDFAEGWLALEFAIPRMGKGVDAIIILPGIIFSVEFKIGLNYYDRGAIASCGLCIGFEKFSRGQSQPARRASPGSD